MRLHRMAMAVAGAGVALAVDGAEDRRLFGFLHQQLVADRAVLDGVLVRVGRPLRSPKRLSGLVAGSLIKHAAGGRPGDLSLFRTLEGLSIAVQAKRCLWRALQAL